MVCRNENMAMEIMWDENATYCFILEPEKTQKKIINAINNLPNVCRKVLLLYALNGSSREAIALKLAISLPAVRFLLCRAGLLLREYLCETKEVDRYLEKMFSGWPYEEYAKLVQMREKLFFTV